MRSRLAIRSRSKRPEVFGKIWYFALCVSFQLETCYTVVPYQICEYYYQVQGENWVNIRDPDARWRYFAVMWLWCIRTEKWEAASIWFQKCVLFPTVKEKETVANKITALYMLEGMILYLVSKLDKNNIAEVIRTENNIKHLIKSLEKAAKATKFILPRLLHLKAYFRFVKTHDSRVDDLIQKAKKYAEKYDNLLEINWIEHSIKAWDRNLKSGAVNFWKEHMEPEELLYYDDIDMDEERVGFFTLPSPLYV